MKPRIVAHTERKAPRVRSTGDAHLARKVAAHVRRHIGSIAYTFVDPLADVVRIDLLWIPADARHRFHTVVTCGMSERAMTATGPDRECRYAELVLRLPANWPFDPTAPQDSAALWPLWELDHVARTPHLYDTYVWAGHTLGNGGVDGTLEPICAGTDFCGVVLLDPDWTPTPFRGLRVDRRREVRFFSVVPLYANELVLAREHGLQTLMDYLGHAGVTDLVDPDRPDLLAIRN